MSKLKMNLVLLIALLFASAVQSFGQTVPPKEHEGKLIAVLKSDASHKEKADACRQLAVIGTKDAIAPLAALLADEKLSHMARYALEPIPDPAVDEALRDALGKLKGWPLVGVIGSIGVRRDAEAVGALTKMLKDPDVEVAQAAARALGSIGNSAAAKALQAALPNASAANQLDLCEGLFRCAEALAAEGQSDIAIEIYDQVRGLEAPHQVRAGALRGAILTRGKEGLPLLREHLRSNDYIMFSAAVQVAQELPGAEVTEALTAVLNLAPATGRGTPAERRGLISADNQILIIQTLGKRGDAGALPALFALAKSEEKPVRITAIRALPEIGHASAVPVLLELLADADSEVSKAAQEAFAALPGQEADATVVAMLNLAPATGRGTPAESRGLIITAIELLGRRRITTSIPALLKAAQEADPKVRPAAIKMVGELGGAAELPALLEMLIRLKESPDLDAAEQALIAVLAKVDNPQSHTAKFTSLLAQAEAAQKSVLLRVLGVIGGTNALRAVRAAVDDSDAQVSAPAIRALCAWKTADAAPDLLVLAKTSPNSSHKTAALRGYIGLVRDESLSTEEKLAMCKEAATLIQRNQEKKLLLGVLATVPAAEALSMAMAHLDDPATKDEASFAVVAISEKIVQSTGLADEVADALRKVMRATDNKDVIRRAKVILGKEKKRAPRQRKR